MMPVEVSLLCFILFSQWVRDQYRVEEDIFSWGNKIS